MVVFSRQHVVGIVGSWCGDIIRTLYNGFIGNFGHYIVTVTVLVIQCLSIFGLTFNFAQGHT